VLLFVGAMGKSAQFFLHTGCGRMEARPGLGPDPRRDMVTAGLHGLPAVAMFEYAPPPSTCDIIGAVTALFAATVGMMQNDISGVIATRLLAARLHVMAAASAPTRPACSTCSPRLLQGVAVPGRGLGDPRHVHEQDMRPLTGGKYPALTCVRPVMVSHIAITGRIPLPNWLAGFDSKTDHPRREAGAAHTYRLFAWITGTSWRA